MDITVDEARGIIIIVYGEYYVLTLLGLLRRVDNVIDSFSGDVYQLVDTTLSLSSGILMIDCLIISFFNSTRGCSDVIN